MLIVDETIETSSGDRTENIVHRPVKSFEEEKALYVRPLPREKGLPNLRQIAGDKAFEYIIGKRYYTLAEEKQEKEPLLTRSFPKVIGFICAAAGIALLAAIYFSRG
jgi:hypothetical protein